MKPDWVSFELLIELFGGSATLPDLVQKMVNIKIYQWNWYRSVEKTSRIADGGRLVDSFKHRNVLPALHEENLG